MKTTMILILSSLYLGNTFAYDLPPQTTKAYDCDTCATLSHDTLMDKWAIRSDDLYSPDSNAQTSLHYKTQVTMKQLRRGIPLWTDAAKAVIRISPLHQSTIPELFLITQDLKKFNLDFGANAPSHQTIWQLKPELGRGKFILQSTDTQQKDDAQFIIHVFDKFSTTYLQVQTDKIHYQFGDTATAIISMKNNDTKYNIKDLSVNLLDPDGNTKTLDLNEIDDNKFQASFQMNSTSNNKGKAWYIEANAYSQLGQNIVKRNGHTAFSYSIPSASLLTVNMISHAPLMLTSKVDVATASRYSLQAVLYTKTDQGNLVPIEISHTSQWLEPGTQLMQFSFDNSQHLDEDRLYLGYIRLIDYGQLTSVYQYDQPIALRVLYSR